MNWRSLIKPANNLSPEEAKEFIASRSSEDYQLLDVRQPGEYEGEHLPGARLIPLKQLADGLKDLDKDKPVLVYCAVGGRSRAAAQFLSGDQVVQHIIVGQGRLIFTDNPGDGFK